MKDIWFTRTNTKARRAMPPNACPPHRYRVPRPVLQEGVAAAQDGYATAIQLRSAHRPIPQDPLEPRPWKSRPRIVTRVLRGRRLMDN